MIIRQRRLLPVPALGRRPAPTCGITHKRTRPYRPQTNGKVERFHRTLADEWAYARPYATETERRAALDPWLHTYNHHRGHTALKGLPPASRVTNFGQTLGKSIAGADGTLGAQVAGEAPGCPAFAAHACDHGRRSDAGDPQMSGERRAPGQVSILAGR